MVGFNSKEITKNQQTSAAASTFLCYHQPK